MLEFSKLQNLFHRKDRIKMLFECNGWNKNKDVKFENNSLQELSIIGPMNFKFYQILSCYFKDIIPIYFVTNICDHFPIFLAFINITTSFDL